MKEANIMLQIFACYLPSSVPFNYRTEVVLKMLNKVEQEIDTNSKKITVCTDISSVKQALHQKKIGAILAIENGMAIENNIKNLKMFFDKGIRLMTIVHAESHDWAISSNDENPDFNGLTDFGEKIITAMNEMGMIIDLSHSHDSTVKRVLSITKKPVIASHSCVYSLCPVHRNLKDKLIKGIADCGGMIGINFFPGFLDSSYSKIMTAKVGVLFDELNNMERKASADIVTITNLYNRFNLKFLKAMPASKVPVTRIFDHLDYIINLVGDDFVGFGSDFDGIPDFPVGIKDCRGFNLISEQLTKKGYSEQTIEKICYKNFLRVFEAHQP